MIRLILVLLMCVCMSCSSNKSTYYAYQKGQDYFTFEVTRNECIYRGVHRKNSTSEDGAESNHRYDQIYVYIPSIYNFSNSPEEDYVYLTNPAIMYSLQNDKYDLCYFSSKEKETSSSIFYRRTSQDTIQFLGSYDEDMFVQSEACFVENGIGWFPPFLVRVKEIDYKKFNLPNIKKSYLKDPAKWYKDEEKKGKTKS